MELFANWRLAYFVFNIPLRFYFACQTSYIHPDEHFQTFQALFHDNFPWEFQNPNFINRSIVPLWLFYKPVLALGEWLNLSPLGVYHLFRFNLVFWNWIIVDWCIYRIMPFKHERVKALFFVSTSWVTLSLQNHTFSNSIETCLLLPTIYLINEIRSYSESSITNKENFSKFKLITLGSIISIGIFNRVTFIAWLILPSIYLLNYLIFHPIRGTIPVFSFIVTSILIIAIDSSYFHKMDILLVLRMIGIDLNFKLLQLRSLPINQWINILPSTLHSSYVIAPLNNLIYNLQEDNLQEHGIHPRYLHLLINYPLIVGPLILLLPPFKLKYWKTTPFLSCLSGLIILSSIKHQELRFLIPMVPLLACLVTLETKSFIQPQTIIKLWIIFSLILSIFYNMIHQAGIVPSMVEVNNLIKPDNLPPVLIFWRTLKPPTWMLNVQHLEFTHKGIDKSLLTPHYFTKFDSINLQISPKDLNVIDLMGSPFSQVESIFNQIDLENQKVYVIAPKNSLMWFENYKLKEIWSTNWHLDMDHFEFNDFKWETFKLGLGIYKINYL